MTLTLPKEKKERIVEQFRDLLGKSSVSIKELIQLISNCSSATTSAISIYAATTNYRIMENWGSQFKSNHAHRGESRTELVGAKPLLNQRKSSNLIIAWWGIMDIIRAQVSCFGTEGSKVCHFNFYSDASNNFPGVANTITHCLKSVRIRSFFWSVFSRIRTV